ncbi:MAG TPA: flagellar type III secretion system pore protein FliP [Planctomycetota bacterium]|nr:flagellar type III secretion system pore protein FliP [Planctomycetota bacterium]
MNHGIFSKLCVLAVTAAMAAAMFAAAPAPAAAGEKPDDLLELPFNLNVGVEKADSPKETVGTLKIIMFFTLLSLLPGLLLTMTSFTRIVIVLSFVRRALSLQNLPPNQVIIGLSLFMTIFIMASTFTEINDNAITPYMNEEISQKEAFDRGMLSMRKFMLKQTREKDLGLFMSMAKLQQPKNVDDVPTHVLIPAFVTSELKTAFQMGFVIYLPFLVIDMVVSSVLTSMGMFMLPPAMISVPFKVLLFVLVDGWNLVIRSLAAGFMG